MGEMYAGNDDSSGTAGIHASEGHTGHEEGASRQCVTHLSDGSQRPLWPGAELEQVSTHNIQQVQQASLRVRLRESLAQLKAMRDGQCYLFFFGGVSVSV